MAPKKPTGEIGATVNSPNSAGWERIQFPTEKHKIEQVVLDWFVKAGQKAGFSFRRIKPNKENDFDFDLTLPGGLVHLELTELMYRDDEGQPYQSRNSRIETLRYANQIVDSIRKKNAHYSAKQKVPIHLLTYITHWRFGLSENVIATVQHLLSKSPLVFEHVFLVTPFHGTEARLDLLYRVERKLTGKLSDLEGHFYLILDPAKGKVIRSSDVQ